MSGERLSSEGSTWILHDPESIEQPQAAMFDPAYWVNHIVGEASGRALAVYIDSPQGRWVLRHYHRGGLVARLSRDRYINLGLNLSRPFREWRLLRQARADGVAVPRPIAAAVHRRGPLYRGDLITERLPGARTLADVLLGQDFAAADWEALAASIARCHQRGYWHADLNARNLLFSEGRWYLIDFDRARRRRPGRWGMGNLQRLRRSLDKLAVAGDWQLSPGHWQHFLRAYHSRLE